jgi:PKD repeat protein
VAVFCPVGSKYISWPPFNGHIVSHSAGAEIYDNDIVINVSAAAPNVKVFKFPDNFNFTGTVIQVSFADVLVYKSGWQENHQPIIGFFIGNNDWSYGPGVWFGSTTWIGAYNMAWAGQYNSYHTMTANDLGAGPHSFIMRLEFLSKVGNEYNMMALLEFTGGPYNDQRFTTSFQTTYFSSNNAGLEIFTDASVWDANNSCRIDDVQIYSPNLVTGSPCRGDIYADFIAAPAVGTIPMEVHFLNQSAALNGIVSYLWSFGDGSQSDEENPIHFFNRIGRYSATLTVYGPDGQDTIRKFEYVIAERQFMRKCLHYGVAEEHGQGWAERSGDAWIWPESQAAILTIINNSYRQEIVFDENSGLPYLIDTRDGPQGSGLIKVFRDKVDPLVPNSGTIIAWEILLGEYTGELEQFYVEILETFLSLRPVKVENINAIGFDVNGLPTALRMDYDLYRDGQIVPYAGASSIPVSRDIVVDRKAKGNSIQIKLCGESTEFKLRKIESSLKVSDFAHNNTSMTEITYQEVVSNPVMWFSRDTNMIDRVTGASMFSSSGFVGNIEGPDGRDDSAFRIVGALDVRNAAYPAGTLLIWHKSGYTISGVSLTELGQSGDWILSYCYNVLMSLLFTNGDVFDIRIFDVQVSLAAMNHYFDNVSEHQGDMYLP